MYPFYGGRPGNSFIIITTYRSVADMVAKFKLGPNYTAVHYDEHVMINAVNKNDPDNGKVYRRGYEFTNSMGGAEYIGTIIGPAGNAPMVQMTTEAEVRRKHAAQGYDERYTSGSYSPVGGNLVPGKAGQNVYNDSITWACVSIRNENDEDTTAYVGFTFPYLVVEYEASSVTPYINGRFADTSSITRVDDTTHPFFEKWHIKVPKGVKGNALMNLRVQPATAQVSPYPNQADDIAHQRLIMTYDVYNYDTYENGNPTKMYLGDYNNIKDVNVADDGTITISFTHEDNKVFSKKVKWVSSISINEITGVFTVNYNNGTPAYTAHLKWVNDVTIGDDGTVTISYTKDADKVQSKLLKWIKNITLDTNGTVTIEWNNGSPNTILNNKVQWISGVEWDESGSIYINWNTGSQTVFEHVIKWPIDFKLNEENGQLSMAWNKEHSYDPEQYETVGIIDWPTDITMDPTSKKLKVHWVGLHHDGGQDVEIGEAINYIVKAAVNNQNHLLVKYADPKQQGNISWNSENGWSDIGTILTNLEYGSDTVSEQKWVGVGQLLDHGTNNKKTLHFTVPLTQLIKSEYNKITVTGGILNADNGVEDNKVANLQLINTNTTITKQLTGLMFDVTTAITATNQNDKDTFTNIAITDLALKFSA